MSVPRVRLLVSVRSPAEAEMACQGGADLIDIKEPSRGSLGMADPDVIESIIGAVGTRAPVSAALGELNDSSRGKLPVGLQYVKVGLSGARRNWPAHLDEAFRRAAPARAIPVAYADHRQVGAPPVTEVLEWARRFGAAGVLIDTATKDGRTLFDWMDVCRVSNAIEKTRRLGMLIVLAGSLRDEHFTQAVALGPDIVAVRGAACAAHDRRQTVVSDQVRRLVRSIEVRNTSSARHAG